MPPPPSVPGIRSRPVSLTIETSGVTLYPTGLEKRGNSRMYSTAGAIGLSLAAMFAVRRMRCARNTASLRGKVVLITGGSRGLGLALAREFGRYGGEIAMCARDPEELEKASQLLGAEQITVTSFVVDLTEHEKLAPFIQTVIERLGRVDILINNAGLIRVGPLESTSLDDYEDAMNLMFWAPIILSRAVLPHMQTRGSGSIINITSIGGRVSIPHLVPYSCAKFALVGFSTGISAELKRSGIHVLTVVPGLMRTGSYLNAKFAGAAKNEFAWFGILGNLPGFSVGADYAASQIRRAFLKRQYNLTISLPAKLLVAFETLLPNLTRQIMAVTNHLLPEGQDRTAIAGKVVDPTYGKPFHALTALGQKAALEYNQ